MSRSLLIVDDEKTAREGMRSFIDWEYYDFTNTVLAVDGLDALEKMEAHRPDVVLLDINMPKMTGIEVMKEIQERGYEAKVIILSGYEEFKLVQKAMRLGAVDYLLKPASPDEIIDAVLRCIALMLEEAEEGREGEDGGLMGLLGSSANLRKLFSESGGIVYPLKEESELLMSIQFAQREEVEHNLRTFIEKTEEYNTDPEDQVKCAMVLISQLSRQCVKSNLGQGSSHSDLSRTDFEDLEELKRILAGIIDRLLCHARETNSQHKAVDRAVRYIDKNFAEHITLESLAKEIDISPAYLSHIFKRFKGVTYLNYLHSVRMKRARELLQSGGHKVYEVAYLVGYPDEKYFAKKFKRLTGMTPSKYCSSHQ